MAAGLRGFDSPEICGKCSEEKELVVRARDFINKLLAAVKTEGKPISLFQPERGKYFRKVADLVVGYVAVGPLLISKGLAKPYNGGKREGRCDL